MSGYRLLLVDGTALLYRAFFAIRGLATRAGRPTNAVFGFVRMLRQLRQTWLPTHLLVVFDGGIPEERLRLLESYKAQRAPMPDDLKAQIGPVERYLDVSGASRIRLPGYEADDVLASVIRQAGGEADEVLIATNDKDLFQLVDSRIAIVAPGKESEKMGPPGVLDKTGVEPHQVPEWLALVGDASDNIPGVPGVGAKTAAKLLRQYGSLEGLWVTIDTVAPERVRKALCEHRDVVARNLAMVRLRADIGAVPAWETLLAREPDPNGLLAFYREMEFDTMAREIEHERLSEQASLF